jgi:OmpA-OmpF porin, OOP family
MTFHRPIMSLMLALALALAVATDSARAAVDPPIAPGTRAPGATALASRSVIKSATLAASGLFDGERLSAATQARLDSMIANAGDLDIEVALLVPSGPWQLAGKAIDEHSLTPARLAALRQHLSRRGVPARHIYVESHIEPSATEPRLVIELVGKPAPQ